MLLDPHAFLFWGSASGCSLLITKTFPIVMVLRVSSTVRMLVTCVLLFIVSPAHPGSQ